ncbi:MAG TPA: hypothetical protein VNK52_16065 [Hyphomicrobiaceae bacterium]|nr:hypothetical protein [Hyphomicrobiaceae bacterium]
MRIMQVHPSLLGALWPSIGRWLLYAARARRLSAPEARAMLEDVADHVLDGRVQMWAVIRHGPGIPVIGVVLTEIPDGERVLRIRGLTGACFLGWRDAMQDRLMAMARDHGCRVMRFTSARRWSRWLPEWRIVARADDGMVYERAVS